MLKFFNVLWKKLLSRRVVQGSVLSEEFMALVLALMKNSLDHGLYLIK